MRRRDPELERARWRERRSRQQRSQAKEARSVRVLAFLRRHAPEAAKAVGASLVAVSLGLGIVVSLSFSLLQKPLMLRPALTGMPNLALHHPAEAQPFEPWRRP